jgi:hypothetical protein
MAKLKTPKSIKLDFALINKILRQYKRQDSRRKA